MSAPGPAHAPVMLDEAVDVLAPRDGETHLDGTFGGGGYARALLAAAGCRVAGIDRDPAAVARGRALEREAGGRFVMLEGRFGELDTLAGAAGLLPLDGIALDVGVSSFQLDDPARGFSFLRDGPLDMRMGGDGPTAADLVNALEERALADLIFRYGEERRARAVAKAIVRARLDGPITRTAALAEIVARAVGRGSDAIHPATRTFQALRIAVNDELGELERGLAAAERALAPGGRLAVVAFHSLEDRIVKRFLTARSGAAPRPSRHAPEAAGSMPAFELLFRGVRTPGAEETARNPRARSARLRAARRTAAPPADDAQHAAAATAGRTRR